MKKLDKCEICSNEITMMAFRGTGVCSENCRKMRDDEDLPRIGVTPEDEMK